MKIEINIEKKHLYYLTGLVCLLLIGLVIANDATVKAYHDPVTANQIQARTNTQIEILDPFKSLIVNDKLTTKDLDVTGNLDVEGALDFGGTVETKSGGWVSSSSGYDWDLGKQDISTNLGTHKFCFLTFVGIKDMENANNEEYHCQVTGSFDGEWTLKTLADAGGAYDASIKCSATCID